MSEAIYILAGVAVVVATFSDVFASVIVPRPADRRWRASSFIARWSWQGWRWFAHSAVDNESREDFLGTFAPLLLICLLGFWVSSLIFGYGCIFYGLHAELKPEPNFGSALYFAGTSLLTIGFGDIVPAGPTARFVSIVTGASGFGTFAILTTFLFAIFGAYQDREAFVVAFCNRAGAPPSGLELIETHARLQSVDGLVESLRESQIWMSAVLETHLAYPVLNYFRSTHDDISWVGALGAILDASTIVLTTVNIPNKAEAVFVNRLGRHFVKDFSHYFRLDAGTEVGVEQVEFDIAYDRLHAAGVPLADRGKAWKHFAEVRSTYASPLNAMAQFWRIPPAQWVGDRSLIGHNPPLKLTPEMARLVDGERFAPAALDQDRTPTRS